MINKLNFKIYKPNVKQIKELIIDRKILYDIGAIFYYCCQY